MGVNGYDIQYFTEQKTRRVPFNSIYQNKKIYITSNIPPRGLNNIGATCYMNSVLQCLYHIYDLSNELLNHFMIAKHFKW